MKKTEHEHITNDSNESFVRWIPCIELRSNVKPSMVPTLAEMLDDDLALGDATILKGDDVGFFYD